jgi:hypothetical protein
MRPSVKVAKAKQSEAMLKVPIGGVFLIGTPPFCLYQRIDKAHVQCLVNTRGIVESLTVRTRINQPRFAHDVEIILLPEDEQSRRIMLAVHGQGQRAIEPYKTQ